MSQGLVGIPLGLALIALLVYLGTMLAFTPSIIVLERLDMVAAIKRSFKLVRNDFWRVFGIWLLGQIVAGLIAGAVSVPFSFGGQILLVSASSTVVALIALVLLSVGVRSVRSSPHRLPPALWCCCTPIAASARRHSTSCCTPARRSAAARLPIPPTTYG